MALLSRVSVVLGIVIAMTCVSAQAASTTFNFDDDPVLEAAFEGETTETSFTQDGLTIYITPTGGDFSFAGSGMGIDTGGDFNVAGDKVDFYFDQDVTITQLDMAGFTPAGLDAGTFSIDGGSSYTLPDDFDNNTSDYIDLSEAVSAGTVLTIAYDAGNGFQWQGLTVEFTAAVPTPAALPAGLGLMGLMIIKRRMAA